jgi:hypothetical protein
VEGAWLGLWILLKASLGRIPFLGIVILVVVAAVAIGSTVTWSFIGIVRVLAHEQSELPLLGRLLHRWWS